MEEGLDVDQVQELEDAEYLDALKRLALDPDFHRVLIRWNQDIGQLALVPLESTHLSVYNWNAARAAFINEVLEGLEDVNPEARLELAQEEIYYVGRRRRGQHRDTGSGYDGPGGN